MGLIDISVGDLVLYKSGDSTDETAGSQEAPAETTDPSVDSNDDHADPAATDADTDPSVVDADATDPSTRRGRLRGLVTRGRLRTAGRAAGAIATFVVALAGLFAVAVALALALAVKIRRKL